MLFVYLRLRVISFHGNRIEKNMFVCFCAWKFDEEAAQVSGVASKKNLQTVTQGWFTIMRCAYDIITIIIDSIVNLLLNQ